MNVLYIGKYPPMEGGTSAAAYWRIKELRRRGISFEVLTCISTTDDYTIEQFDGEDQLHLIKDKVPWHIPYSQLYSERLISAAIELLEHRPFDAIEGCYLFPYGFAAYVAAELFHLPLILRHAGSDLYRLSKGSNFKSLLSRMSNAAYILVTYEECIDNWIKLGASSNLYVASRYVPNPAVFKAEGNHTETVFLGKVTERWERRQFDYYYAFLVKHDYHGKIQIYSNEYTIDEFARYFQARGYEVVGHPFVMPNKVPQILQDTKYLLISTAPDGIPESSNCIREALSAGCVPVYIGTVDAKLNAKPDYEGYIREQLRIYARALGYERF